MWLFHFKLSEMIIPESLALFTNITGSLLINITDYQDQNCDLKMLSLILFDPTIGELLLA